MARIVRAGEASSEAERRNEGSTKCVRNSEKPDFCEAKSHPKNENSKFDIYPNLLFCDKLFIIKLRFRDSYIIFNLHFRDKRGFYA